MILYYLVFLAEGSVAVSEATGWIAFSGQTWMQIPQPSHVS